MLLFSWLLLVVLNVSGQLRLFPSPQKPKEKTPWYHIPMSAAQAGRPASSQCYFGDFCMEIFACLLTFL